MVDRQNPKGIAVNRYKIIAPIIAAMEEKADMVRLVMLKKEACAASGISMRTMRRWPTRYRQNGFEGLKPADWSGSGPCVIPEKLMAEAQPGQPPIIHIRQPSPPPTNLFPA